MTNFIRFIWEERENRRDLIAALVTSVALIIVFKLFYPYPNMVIDSYFYLRAAADNANVALWPVGYSKFLRVIILLFHSTTALVCIQYLLLELACLFFYFTVTYFWRLKDWLMSILFLFLFVNPLFLYSCNFIMSDSLFLTLSILWITLLMWIVKSPKAYMMWIHALLLLCAFTVRNNALFYPVIGALAFLLSPQKLWKKVAGIALQIAVIAGFVIYTSNQMAVETGIKLFTPFTGWKMANNALYMYGHQYQKDTSQVPDRFVALDQIVRFYFNKMEPVDNLLDYDAFSGGSFYMFRFNSPLVHYMQVQVKKDVYFIDLKYSAQVASLYSEYGQYLIKKDPIAFIKYFIYPDAIRYMYPPMESLSSLHAFSLRDDDLSDLARKWLKINTLRVSPYLINLRAAMLSPFPLIVCLTQVLFLIGLAGFLLVKGIRRSDRSLNKCLLLVVSYCVLDFCFSVTTASMILRYLLFILVLKFTFSLVFIDYYMRRLKPDKN
ncbi:MAG TPA: hypothetical protein VFE32_04305 [Puia sp.]|jgi:hypothetical protein|nr:hypothetical protein [Puia sp.]